jgi:polysaccharide chain length determinant protein (PEP-CTERM system associated)
LAMIVAWLVAVGGWIWVYQVPDAYVASTRVYVDTNSVLRPLLKGLTIGPNIDQRINMMSRTLLSRPNLDKLMRMTDLDLMVESEQDKERMQSALSDSITLAGDRRNASLYSITVTDPDRGNAKRIAQALITIFIENSLTGKREDNSDAQEFLEEQISDYELRLAESENRLARFKQTNVDLLAGGEDYYSRLRNSKVALEQAKLMLSEMENRRRELQRQVDGEDPVFITSSVTGAVSLSPIDARIQSLQSSLDSLQSQYTDKHPKVRQIRGLVLELEAEKTAEYQRVREDTALGFTGLSNSPVYQGMRSMLAETEASVAELQVRVAEFGKREQFLEAKVTSVPEIEAQLKQLDRDYRVVATQHQELLERRESARLSRNVAQNTNEVTFRVIDPPFVPLSPSEPNKPLLNGIVLVLGIAAGIGSAFLVSLINPLVGDPRTLVSLSGLPLLGSVSLKQPPEDVRRELYANVMMMALGLALVLACLGVSLGQGLLSI